MTINGIPGAYSSYGSYRPTSRTTSSSASKVSASEDGLFEPISSKVSSALSDEYIEQIKAQARADAAKGRYMDGYDSKQRTGFSAMRDAQMKQYVSPDREKATSPVSAAINDPNRVWKHGATLLDLLGIPYTAKVFNGPVCGITAEIRDENGEMIAGYNRSCGWFDVPTKDETRFQYESNQIYYEAYNAAKAEMANAAQQTAASSVLKKDIYIAGGANSDVCGMETRPKALTPDMASALSEKYDVKNMTRNEYGKLLQELRDSGVVSSKDFSVGFGGAVPYTEPDGVQMTFGSADWAGIDAWPSGSEKVDFTKLLRACARYCTDFASKQEEGSDGEIVSNSLSDSYTRLLKIFEQIDSAARQKH